MLRCRHIYIANCEDYFIDSNHKPKDADRKYAKDVFRAFPDVQFTINCEGNISMEKAIILQKEYQNVVINFRKINDRYKIEAFSQNLES